MKRITRRISIVVLKLLILLIVLSTLWVILYRFVNPPISGMMVYKSITEMGYEYEWEWKDLEEINAALPLAFIAAEDQLFLEHNGFDVEAIKEAIEHNKESDRKRGASTISQQLAKNLFLFPTRSFLRKGLEVYFTFLLESLWSKRRIMEVYLNVVELGTGVYGVEQACKHFYGTSAKNANRNQAALFGAALPNPILFKVNRPSAYMLRRQNWILRQMNNLGSEAILNDWYE